jgi:AcrR family transcriptional regulator
VSVGAISNYFPSKDGLIEASSQMVADHYLNDGRLRLRRDETLVLPEARPRPLGASLTEVPVLWSRGDWFVAGQRPAECRHRTRSGNGHETGTMRSVPEA